MMGNLNNPSLLGGLYGLPDLNQQAVANNGMIPGGLNINPIPGQTQQQQPAQPFVWGQGGAQLTPDQLALRQKIALQNQQTDYSPIQSPWQGLARVAQNVEGALDEKALDKQADQQRAEGNQIVSALAATDPATYSPSLVAAALSSANPQARSLGQDIYDKAHPKPFAPTDFQRLGVEAGLTPDQIRQGAAQKFANEIDPLVTFVTQGNTTTVPRSVAQSQFPQPSSLPTVSDQASYDKVASGGQYKDPQGHIRVKP